ncbi:hypothetical protein RI367_007439 [Sorochytrium milnesiophthora]
MTDEAAVASGGRSDIGGLLQYLEQLHSLRGGVQDVGNGSGPASHERHALKKSASVVPQTVVQQAKRSLGALNHQALAEMLPNLEQQHAVVQKLLVHVLQLMADGDVYGSLLDELAAITAHTVAVAQTHIADGTSWQLACAALLGVLQDLQPGDTPDTPQTIEYPRSLVVLQSGGGQEWSIQVHNSVCAVTVTNGALVALRVLHQRGCLVGGMPLSAAQGASGALSALLQGIFASDDDTATADASIALAMASLRMLESVAASSLSCSAFVTDAALSGALQAMQILADYDKLGDPCCEVVASILQLVLDSDHQTVPTRYLVAMEQAIQDHKTMPVSVTAILLDLYTVALSLQPAHAVDVHRVLDRILARCAQEAQLHEQVADLFCVLLCLDAGDLDGQEMQADLLNDHGSNSNVSDGAKRKRRRRFDETPDNGYRVYFGAALDGEQNGRKRPRRLSTSDADGDTRMDDSQQPPNSQHTVSTDGENSGGTSSDGSRIAVQTAHGLLAHMYNRLAAKHSALLESAAATTEGEAMSQTDNESELEAQMQALALDMRLLQSGVREYGESEALVRLVERLLGEVVQRQQPQTANGDRYALELAYSLNELLVVTDVAASEAGEQAMAAVAPTLRHTGVLRSDSGKAPADASAVTIAPSAQAKTALLALSLGEEDAVDLDRCNEIVELCDTDANVAAVVLHTSAAIGDGAMQAFLYDFILSQTLMCAYKVWARDSRKRGTSGQPIGLLDCMMSRQLGSRNFHSGGGHVQAMLSHYIAECTAEWTSASNAQRVYFVQVLRRLYTSAKDDGVDLPQLTLDHLQKICQHLRGQHLVAFVCALLPYMPSLSTLGSHEQLYVACMTAQAYTLGIRPVPSSTGDMVRSALRYRAQQTQPLELRQTLSYRELMHRVSGGSARAVQDAVQQSPAEMYSAVKQLLSAEQIQIEESSEDLPDGLEDTAQAVGVGRTTIGRALATAVLPVIVQRSDVQLLPWTNSGGGVDATTASMHRILVHLLVDQRMWRERPDEIYQSIAISLPDANRHAKTLAEVAKGCELDVVIALVERLDGERLCRGNDVYEALLFIVQLAAQRPKGRHTSVTDALAHFLGGHFLGVLVHLNSVATDAARSDGERAKAVRCLAQLVQLTGPQLQVVFAQVVSALQAHARDPALLSATFDVWQALVRSVDERLLLKQLPLVVVMVAETGSSAGVHTAPHEQADGILAQLIGHPQRAQQLQGTADIDALRHFPDIERQLLANRSHIRPLQRVRLAVQAAHAEEPVLVRNALAVLLRHLDQAPSPGGGSDDNITADDASSMRAAARQALWRFGEHHPDIAQLCGQLLGRFWKAGGEQRLPSATATDGSSDREAFSAMDAIDIEQEAGASRFGVWLLERVLVPAFKRTTGPREQTALSYAMQEMLKLSGGDLHKLNEDARDICAPLLTSKYYISHSATDDLAQQLTSRDQLSEPGGTVAALYDGKLSHREWITRWCARLVRMPGLPARTRGILHSLLPAVMADVHVAQALVPYVAMRCLLSGGADGQAQVHAEVAAVLRGSQNGHECDVAVIKMLFTVLDRLNLMRAHAKDDSDRRKGLDSFFAQLPKQRIARAALSASDYNRAVMWLEAHIRLYRGQDAATPIASFEDAELDSLYRQMYELHALSNSPDEAAGISALVCRRDPQLELWDHELSGRWVQAHTIHETRLADAGEHALEHHVGIVRCLRNLGHYETALSHVAGVQASGDEVGGRWGEQLRSYAVEAALNLSRWDKVAAHVGDAQQASTSQSKGVLSQIGNALLSLRKGAFDLSERSLDSAREMLVLDALHGSVGNGRVEEHGVQLRQVFEAQVVLRLLRRGVGDNKALEVTLRGMLYADQPWQERIKKQPESLLSFRRSLLSILRERTDAQETRELCDAWTSKLWLQSADSARRRGDHVGVYRCVLQTRAADELAGKVALCRSLWDRGEGQLAIVQLSSFLRHYRPPDGASVGDGGADLSTPSLLGMVGTSGMSGMSGLSGGKDADMSDQFRLAHAQLTLARWIDQLRFEDTNSVIQRYRQVCSAQHNWDKAFFLMGRFYTVLYTSSQGAAQSSSSSQFNTLVMACRSFAKCLSIGPRYADRALPKMLTLWLNAGTPDKDSVDIWKELLTAIKNLESVLPTYVWTIALSQILSRIAHPDRDIYSVLESVLVNIMCEYPAQAMWRMTSVLKSTDSERARRCNAVLDKAMSRRPELEVAIKEFNALAGELVKLSRLEGHNKRTLSLRQDMRSLVRMSGSCGTVLIPRISSLTPVLPRSASDNTRSVFSEDAPTIASFEDDVVVMTSLVSPKKLTIVGSDGRRYAFLCKPQDDLRKDGRLIEFTSMVNRLLSKDDESRLRGLHIRTFSVIPLNHSSGIIEWVPHTAGYRQILMDRYKRHGIVVNREMTKWLGDQFKRKDLEAAFQNDLLGRFQPVLHEWFVHAFPDPSLWHAARSAFTRTSAVMSMAGFVLGLGDRHGENLLVDVTNGEVVHVDFNCLFDKGLTFQVPERVPFRLTQNMVDGFGLSGYDGAFRKSCEVSLRVLREHKEALMTVLETFVHDPLCEWDKSKSSRKNGNESKSNMTQTAKRMLEKCEHKLSGWVGPGLLLGVEGQVQKLIRDATDPKLLSQMYIGWAAYL